MLNKVKKTLRIIRGQITHEGHYEPHSTFKSYLNHEVGRIYYVLLLIVVIWPFFIPMYFQFHPYPRIALTLNIILLTSSTVVLLLRITNKLGSRFMTPFFFVIMVFVCSNAVLAGLAGSMIIYFMYAYVQAIMIPVYTPLSFKHKVILSLVSIVFFFSGLFWGGLQTSSSVSLFLITNLIAISFVSLFFAYSMHYMRLRSWRQRQELAEMMEEIESKTRLEEEMKAAQEANQAKSDFLAKMSHEIRTPMNAVIGMTELSLREEMSGAAREYMYAIEQASHNLLSIINDILDFSKIETGKMEIIDNDYSLSSVLYDTVNIIKAKVYQTKLRFVVNIASNTPSVLVGDSLKIRQILLNLLGNSVKYSKEGYVSLTVSFEVMDEENINLIIEATDSGIGIKQEELDKLFEEFTQLDVNSNVNVEGTGLGLAITQGFVRKMNGSIEVDSEYGKGSTFTVTIPQKVSDWQALATIDEPEEKRILIFERRRVNAESIVKTLDDLGVACETVGSSDELKTKIADGEYTHVFTAPVLFDDVKSEFPDLLTEENLALFSGFGDQVANKGVSIIATPIFCLSIANFLNKTSDDYTGTSIRTVEKEFIAPDATVLIVDDIEINVMVVEGLLEPYKMRIDSCSNGAEAVEAVKSSSYDLVLMDHMMPVMDGVEATAKIRAMAENGDSYFRDLPIIALTANAVSGMREMFLGNDFNDFIPKPIEPKKINAILERWIPKDKQIRSADINQSVGVD